MELPTVEKGRVTYPLCGGSFCFSKNPKCKNTCVLMKHFLRSTWTVGNVAIVSCGLAQVCNQHNLITEIDTKKFLRAQREAEESTIEDRGIFDPTPS